MKINWEVRMKNSVFWVQILAAVFLPVLTYFGLQWEELTTWTVIGQLLVEAVKNPVVVLVLVSVWNAINDPTTVGLQDSSRAMTYHFPYQ